MKRTILISFIFCLLLLPGSCSPLQKPMPDRPSEELQKTINESWEKALTPIHRFDNQALLDILLITKAYQLGVDKLDFRSEKSFSGGTVVMEIRYDRLLPDKDRFEVQILSHEGKILRRENYDRKQIEKTDRELAVDYERLQRKKQEDLASPEELKRLEGYQARYAVIFQIFPKAEEKEKKEPEEKVNAK